MQWLAVDYVQGPSPSKLKAVLIGFLDLFLMQVLYVYIPRHTQQWLTQAVHFSRPTLQLQTLSNISHGVNNLYNIIPCGSKWLCFIRSRYEKFKQRTLNQVFILIQFLPRGGLHPPPPGPSLREPRITDFAEQSAEWSKMNTEISSVKFIYTEGL